MPGPEQDDYVEAFEARCAAAEGPGTQRMSGPGLSGLVGLDGTSPTQLLVLDDRALAVLADVLPLATTGSVRVHVAAERCAEMLRRQGWAPNPVTAMVRRELGTVPDLPLPEGLSLRSVRRVPEEPPDWVPLADAVAAAGRATAEVSPPALAAYLRSLPEGPRLFAAVDDCGTVRATSGSRTFSSEAYVFFVNTDPGWRRRGVGLAMTATALRSAATAGADRACLDASGVGIPLYERLGFTAVGSVTQFNRPG